jgi:hypothetical protein
VDPWDETIEPDWFPMPTPLRTSGFSCSRVEHPLLTHPWLLTCSRVTCCLARAHAYGIESSRLLVEHSRSHPRTHQSNSTRNSGSCNFAAGPVLRVGPVPRYSCPDRLSAAQLLLPSSPRYKRTSASARIEVCSHLATSKSSTSSPQCRLISSAAFSSTASDVLHVRLHCFPRAGPR